MTAILAAFLDQPVAASMVLTGVLGAVGVIVGETVTLIRRRRNPPDPLPRAHLIGHAMNRTMRGDRR